MNVMILGASGFLGSHLCNFLKIKNTILRCGRSKNSNIVLKKIEQKKFSKILKKYTPDVIINLIALTNVDLCEKKKKKAEKINSGVVKIISQSVKKTKLTKKIFLLHISTDQVYSGEGLHKENSVKPLNTYAKTKLSGEKYIKKVNGCVIRTNFFGKPLNKKKQGISDWVFRSLKKRKKIPVFKNIKFSPLSISSLCKYIEIIINKKIPGIYNLGSKNGLSKAEFAIKFAKKLELNTKLLKIIDYKKEQLIAKRPLDMRMNINLFEKKFKIKLKSLNSEINLISKQYKENR